MVKKLIFVYENKIIKEEPKKRLGAFGWIYIILSVICILGFFVFEYLHFDIGALIAMGLFILISIAFVQIANYMVSPDENTLVDFKNKTVDKFSKILETGELNNKESIEVIINQCKEYEESKNIIFGGTHFKEVFTLAIYPIITAAVAIIVKDIPDKNKIEWSIFWIGVIVIMYMIIELIYPIIDDYLNKYQRIAKMMRHDLEYLLAIENRKCNTENAN